MAMPKARTAMALIDEMAARHANREALVGGGERYSWAEFRTEVRMLAKGLHAAGVRRGDKVAILMGNRPEWLIADFAIMALGGVMVAANTWATARELAYQLSHSESRVLIMSAGFLKHDYAALIEEARAEDYDLSGLERIFCLNDGPPPDGMEAFEELSRLGADVPDSDIDAAQAAVEGEEVVLEDLPRFRERFRPQLAVLPVRVEDSVVMRSEVMSISARPTLPLPRSSSARFTSSRL